MVINDKINYVKCNLTIVFNFKIKTIIIFNLESGVIQMFESWSETLYDETFSDMFDALVEEYKNGEITVEQLKVNLAEQQQILLNAFTEGEVKSTYCNAMVDAHQYVLALINNGKIVRE